MIDIFIKILSRKFQERSHSDRFATKVNKKPLSMPASNDALFELFHSNNTIAKRNYFQLKKIKALGIQGFVFYFL